MGVGVGGHWCELVSVGVHPKSVKACIVGVVTPLIVLIACGRDRSMCVDCDELVAPVPNEGHPGAKMRVVPSG